MRYQFDIRIRLFNAVDAFRENYRLGYLLATLLNAAIAIFMVSWTVFFVRQSLLTLVIGFFCFFNEEVLSARRDLSQVQETLKGHNRIFRYDVLLIFLSLVAGFICIINMTNEMPKGLLYLSVSYLIFFCVYTFYRWFCICTLPAARSAFTRRPLPVGAATGRRHISTYIASGLKYLPEVSRGLAFVGNGLSLIAGHSGVYKIAYGIEARPPAFNAISYVSVGLTCPTESGYLAGISLINAVEKLDPGVRSKIIDPNSYGRINEGKVFDYITEHDSKKDHISKVIKKDLQLLRLIAKARGLLDPKDD